MKRQLLKGIFILAILGLADALYLLSKSLMGDPLSCLILDGCNIVAASEYSRIFGIPLSAFGVAFYLATLILAYGYWHAPKVIISQALLAVTGAGILSSGYFMYLQMYVIKAYCVYCIFSAIISALLFVLAIILIRSNQE